MNRLALAALLAALPAVPVAAAPDPPAPGCSVSLYSGTSAVVTRGERREYLTGRASLGCPVGAGFALFARADLTGTQDGGSLDTFDPQSFRSIVAAAGVEHGLGPLEVGALGAVTYSIEGDSGAPVDPRLFSAIGLARYKFGDGGYIGAGGGLHQPAGGLAAIFTASVPIEGAYATTDFALPLKANALAEKTWVLHVGATVRLKRLELRRK